MPTTSGWPGFTCALVTEAAAKERIAQAIRRCADRNQIARLCHRSVTLARMWLVAAARHRGAASVC